jgi:hypothetical protein
VKTAELVQTRETLVLTLALVQLLTLELTAKLKCFASRRNRVKTEEPVRTLPISLHTNALVRLHIPVIIVNLKSHVHVHHSLVTPTPYHLKVHVPTLLTFPITVVSVRWDSLVTTVKLLFHALLTHV